MRRTRAEGCRTSLYRRPYLSKVSRIFKMDRNFFPPCVAIILIRYSRALQYLPRRTWNAAMFAPLSELSTSDRLCERWVQLLDQTSSTEVCKNLTAFSIILGTPSILTTSLILVHNIIIATSNITIGSKFRTSCWYTFIPRSFDTDYSCTPQPHALSMSVSRSASSCKLRQSIGIAASRTTITSSRRIQSKN